MLAERAALATTHAAAHVDLAGGLGEREEVRAVACGAVLAEHALHKVVERALEVAERDALVHHEALDLVELRQMAGIGRVGAVHAARGNHVDGRLLRLHGVHLDAGGLGAQQHVGLAMGVLLGVSGRAGRVVAHVERIAGRTARVVERGVQRGEVVPAGLDLRTLLHGVADTAEDVLDLLDDLVDEVGVTDVRAGAGQRDVHGLGGHELAHGGALHLLHTRVEQSLGHAAHLVGALAEHRSLLGRDLAHHAHEAGDLALAAHEGHACGLELLRRLGALDHLAGSLLELLKFVDQTHLFPSPVMRRAGQRADVFHRKIRPWDRAFALPKDGS